MITDKEIQKIFDWADKNDIQNKGINKEVLGDKVLVWRKGIPRRKNNLLEIEYFELDSWKHQKVTILNELFKLPKLKGLSISLEQLNHIDRQNLQKIVFLKIDVYSSTKKDFIEFTDTLKTYTNLEYLHILNGKLNKISEDIFYLNNLKYLKLYGWENIKELPSDIKKLNKLEVFALEACHLLTTISSDIQELENLKILSFRWSRGITEIPREIGNLTQLKELDLCCTNIKKLPNEISNLINLEKLNGDPYIRIKNENKSIDKSLLKQFQEAKGRKKIEILRKIKISKNSLKSLSFEEKRTIQKDIKRLQFLLNPSKTNLFSIFSKEEHGNLTFPHKNLLLKGVTGTGKSFTIDKIIKNELKLTKEHKKNILRINIHSASSNADLMQGIGINSNNGKIEYKEKQGLIYNHIKKALFSPHQPFVLILEEIQENSLNELIGDLIYLIEPQKRVKVKSELFEDGKEYDYQELIDEVLKGNEHYIEIPYLVDTSTEYRKMVMPDNLYIFCTSNYRDDKKVIEDNLLRRFDVIEVYPKYNSDIFKSEDIAQFLKRLNREILKQFDQEMHPDRYLIGHANWINIGEENKKPFYTALLKVIIEFKEIREVDFKNYTKKILEKVLQDSSLSERIKKYIKDCEFKYNSYKEMVEKLQSKIYPFL